MMSLSQIQYESRAAAAKAAREDKHPFIVEAEDLKAIPPFPFPFIGDYVPDGWRKVEDYFVDSSGFGRPGEPALTIEQFVKRLTVGHGYAITEAGQFQLYVGEYVQV